MPAAKQQACWVTLDQIGQILGQVNGMAYGCERWNVPALQNLDRQLQDLFTTGSPTRLACFPGAIDSLAHSEADPGPLREMADIVHTLLETYGPTEAGFKELAGEAVGRVAADATVGELQTYWMQVVKGLSDWYGASQHQPGHDWRLDLPIPEASRPLRQEMR